MLTKSPEWGDAEEIARVLGGMSARNVQALVDEGLIRRRDLPGVRRRFYLPDALKLKDLALR